MMNIPIKDFQKDFPHLSLFFNLSYSPSPETTENSRWYKLFHSNFWFVAVVQLLSPIQLFATPWTATGQVSMSCTISWCLLKLMSIELVMPSNHLIFCHPILLLPPIFPSIRVYSNESVLHSRLPKYWSFSFNISPSKECSELTGLISMQSKGLSSIFSNTTVQKHQFFGAQFYL